MKIQEFYVFVESYLPTFYVLRNAEQHFLIWDKLQGVDILWSLC